MSTLPTPESRNEQYQQYIATGSGTLPAAPESRIEEYLAYICEHGSGGGLEVTLVDTTVYPTLAAFLASTGETGKLYLYPDAGASSPNTYLEFLWITSLSRYEQIGSTEIDLTNYWNTAKASPETWTFTYADGTTATKKVLIDIRSS